MIEREITGRLKTLFQQYPFVTVTGPRQSGKTTLCRSAFPNLAYTNLEAPDQREFAESDPRGFLSQLGGGAIIDEVQHVPALLSYLQVLADELGRNGLFVLSGSEQFRLSNAISQSLAGRTALLRLLPFSLRERRLTGASEKINDIVFSGFYPRILNEGLDPHQALGDYFETYVERDVRRLGEIRNLSAFRRFVRLCAGRVGQLANVSSLGSDVGVSHTTAREWLTVLETSYIVFQLPPFHANLRKRLIKSPKFYFYDVGLASYLIGIENAGQVATHPLRGALFENLVVAEALKHRFNRGRQSNFSFYRDSRGLECDLLYETGQSISAIEIKSGSTVSSDYFGSLNKVANLIPKITGKFVVYGGATRQSRKDCTVLPLSELGGILERYEVTQAVTSFVRERSGPAPVDLDIRSLDTAYRAHIRPTLERIESTLKPLGDGLFRALTQISYVSPGGVEKSWVKPFQIGDWEMTKRENILSDGFKLNDDRPLKLGHDYRFNGYTGIGGNGFDLVLSVEWTLGGNQVSWRVTIDGTPVPQLEADVDYSELEARRTEIDHTVAEITGRVLMRIDALSREQVPTG